jgi:hypothetical protein
MSAAGVFPIVVMSAAGVSFFVMVVVALKVCAGRESSGEIGLDRRFCAARNTADHFDARLGKRGHRTASDAAADEQVNLVVAEEARERTVSNSARRDDFGRGNLSVRDFAHEELRRVAEVLEHLTVFRTYSYSHRLSPCCGFVFIV